MRKLCPNIDKEDGLETVLEVPIPEEMFATMGSNVTLRWQNMLTWMRAQTSDKWSAPIIAGRLNELRFLLYLVGSPLIPLQVQLGNSIHRPVKDSSIVCLSLYVFSNLSPSMFPIFKAIFFLQFTQLGWHKNTNYIIIIYYQIDWHCPVFLLVKN